MSHERNEERSDDPRVSVPAEGAGVLRADTVKHRLDDIVSITTVPRAVVGPVHIAGDHAVGVFEVPFATTEGALARTYTAGLRCFGADNPVRACVEHSSIHITPMFRVACHASALARWLGGRFEDAATLVAQGFGHCRLLRLEPIVLDDLVLCKCVYDTADAQGLNTINDATERILHRLMALGLPFGASVFLRSHFSGVKHHSVLNEHLGYGKRVRASARIPATVLRRRLKVTAHAMTSYVNDARRCAAAAGIARMNIHAANGIAAVMLATGQDIADMVNSGVAETEFTVDSDDALIVNVVIFNLNVATVGGGTALPTQRVALESVGCFGGGLVNRLAEIIGAVAVGGEVATVAAILRGNFVRAHLRRREKENE
ncbi:MAG: hypothetical protein IPK26_02605 [Planctomycetes bacterium]|nr:hypothetical protein [Planctomycetota bacterium]